MRFALVGHHADGIDLVFALIETGRHELVAYSGPAAGATLLRERGLSMRSVGDIEEVLADPAVEAVIVAGNPLDRPAQLRRAVQSERHVLCVHPADQVPDIAYEAAMIQADTRQVLLPLLPMRLHPGVARLRELARTRDMPLGKISLIEMELKATGRALVETDATRHRSAVPGWDVLRALGGELAEVSAFTAAEALDPDQPLLVTGRFENGTLFRASYLPNSAEPSWRIRLTGDDGEADLLFPGGWPTPARLSWHKQTGEKHEESWETAPVWLNLVAVFEAAIGPPSGTVPALVWQDEVRCLELDAAAQRSVHYRRVSVMEYQEASEEVGFKGTMTLIGCGILWCILLLLILSVWFPRIGWLIVPVLALFLVLQLFRWVIPAKK